MSISDDLKLKRSSSIKRRGRGFLEFITLKNEIEDALTEGFNVIEIWELLSEQGKVSVGYDAFAKYVRKSIHKKPQQLSKDSSSHSNTLNSGPASLPKKDIPGFIKPEPSGFRMDSDVRTSGIKDLLK